ncbi:Charged multivesicular body protein 4c [Armadillidium nasatum]|uniref:Charged multivesicular body protein 4c n=1 Tax=Armadillidium nasatum TaxID=96803 RepID=A0A5N5SWR0_9CRUS|nr:Charged multivesicular body protein 4c [Armadillidium nasatum]
MQIKYLGLGTYNFAMQIKLSISDCELITSLCRLSISDWELITSLCRVSISDCELITSLCRLSISDWELITSLCRLSISDCELITSLCRADNLQIIFWPSLFIETVSQHFTTFYIKAISYSSKKMKLKMKFITKLFRGGKVAILSLKRKKRYEKELVQIDGTLFAIEMQREALEGVNANTKYTSNYGRRCKSNASCS